MTFSVGTLVLKVALDLTLGVCIKLFCDNGRIHWRDLVNDLPYWPHERLAADGLTRQIRAEVPSAGALAALEAPVVEEAAPLAAK